VVAVALYFFLHAPHGARPVPIHYHLGASSGRIEEVALRYRRAGDDTVVYDTTLRFPSGAPADLYQEPRLAAGEYEVGVRLRAAGGGERQLTRRLYVDGERGAEVELE
jgi:hypothetical protein